MHLLGTDLFVSPRVEMGAPLEEERAQPMRRRQTSKQRRVQMTTITQAAVGADGPPRSRLGPDTSSWTCSWTSNSGWLRVSGTRRHRRRTRDSVSVRHYFPKQYQLINLCKHGKLLHRTVLCPRCIYLAHQRGDNARRVHIAGLLFAAAVTYS